MRQNAFTILFILKNKKKINYKNEDNNKNIEIVVIKYYKVVGQKYVKIL
jgi:hypothetical protein